MDDGQSHPDISCMTLYSICQHNNEINNGQNCHIAFFVTFQLKQRHTYGHHVYQGLHGTPAKRFLTCTNNFTGMSCLEHINTSFPIACNGKALDTGIINLRLVCKDNRENYFHHKGVGEKLPLKPFFTTRICTARTGSHRFRQWLWMHYESSTHIHCNVVMSWRRCPSPIDIITVFTPLKVNFCALLWCNWRSWQGRI